MEIGVIRTSGDRSGGGSPATGAGFAGRSPLPNGSARVDTARIDTARFDTARFDTARIDSALDGATSVGPALLLSSNEPAAGLNVPSRPTAPGPPSPAGAPGCPGHSGSGSAGSGSLQIAATTPARQYPVLPANRATDGYHAAASLTRCDEPGSSPD